MGLLQVTIRRLGLKISSHSASISFGVSRIGIGGYAIMKSACCKKKLRGILCVNDSDWHVTLGAGPSKGNPTLIDNLAWLTDGVGGQLRLKIRQTP